MPEVIDNDDNVRTVSNNNNNNGNTDDDNVEIVDDNQTNNSSHNEEMKNKTINDGGKPLVVVLDWQQRSSSSSTSSNNVATNKSTSVIKIDADKNETNNNIDRNGINIDKQVEVALNELEDTLEQCSLFNNINDDDDDGNHDEKLSSSSSSLNGTKIKLNGQIKTTTTTSKTSSSMGNNRTTKVVINSMYDNNNNNHNGGDINRLSSNSFSVRDGIRKFNTINETNVSQQDLSSLRSTTVQLNPFVRRSTSKIYNDDSGGEKMPKVNRKLDNFQIGSLSESPIDIYQMKKPSSMMMTNVVRNNDNTKTSTVIQINNSNNDNNNNKTTTATAPIHHNGNVNKLSSVVVVNNDNHHRDKYLMKQKSESMINNNNNNNNNNHEIQHRSNNNRPMLITTNNNVFNKNNTINVNNNNNNHKIRLSKQHSNGSIKQLSSPSSSSSPSPTDFLQELKLKSKTWSHRNGLEFSNPAYDEVDTNQNSELRQRNFLQQKSVDNVSISIPPPPPPPPSQPLVPLTQSVNRMISSQTLLAPKGWNQNRPTSKSNNQIHSPLRSVSMDLSKNTSSSSSSDDSRGALLNEIKNFHNNSRLKKVIDLSNYVLFFIINPFQFFFIFRSQTINHSV